MNRFYIGESLDNIWRSICESIMKDGEEVSPRGQITKEIRHVSFELTNPRNRIIFNPIRKFSLYYAVAEILWYLSTSNEIGFLNKYNKRLNQFSDDGITLNSAYGFRIFTNGHPLIPFDQWTYVKDLLIKDPLTRQAVIHVRTPNNIYTKDEVCTLCLQFFIRNNKLELAVTMRSNDLVWGTAYDVFTFTMLQEMMANSLGLELGSYYHYSGSMHVYDRHFNMVLNSFNFKPELYNNMPMPKLENFKENALKLLAFEKEIEVIDYSIIDSKKIYQRISEIDKEWIDFGLILLLHKLKEMKLVSKYEEIKSFIKHESYLSLLKYSPEESAN